MSSIRIFILGAVHKSGPLHGYQLKQLADESHVHNWTDITPGAIYGALKRLLSERLLEEVRVEREGGRPERQIVDISEAGRMELVALRLQALTEFRLLPDPFDLAFAGPFEGNAVDLTGILTKRLDRIETERRDYAARIGQLSALLTPLERLAMEHRLMRLDAEVLFLRHALGRITSIPTH